MGEGAEGRLPHRCESRLERHALRIIPSPGVRVGFDEMPASPSANERGVVRDVQSDDRQVVQWPRMSAA